jgi:hypothetical protein
MTYNPRARNQLGISKNASQPRLQPGIPDLRSGNQQLDAWAAKLKERLEVGQGARGGPFDTWLTKRDLNDALTQLGIITQGLAPASGGIAVQGPNGGIAYTTYDEFAREISNTKIFQDLAKSVNDLSRFDGFPDQVKNELLQNLADEAAQRGAAIRRLDQTIQSATDSFAQTVTEITASVQGAEAGVRQVAFASANANRATAGTVTQITARLDGFGGGSATIEEVATATADRLTGLAAEYYVKLQAGNKVAGFGLAASEDPTGATSSAFIILADKFAVVTGSTTITDPNNPPAAYIPFGVDSSGAYINGSLRINATGGTLNDLLATTGINVFYSSEFWKVDSTGAAVNTSINLGADLTSGLTGYVTWTKSGTGTAPPTAGTTNSWTIYAADQTDDTVTYTAALVSGSVTYTDSVTIVRLRDGSDALTGMLTNESHTVPCSSAGVVSSFTGASGGFRVFKGSTDITGLCTFAIQANPSTLTASINSTTGAYSVTAAGSWASGTATTTITFRATYGTTTIDKIFTLTKALAGTAGAPGTNGGDGLRGSLTGYGAGYGIASTSWSDGIANRVINNMLTGSTLTSSLASTSQLRLGDTVTESDGVSFAQTKFWSGTAWVVLGEVIDGNLLVKGTVAADQLNINGTNGINLVSGGGTIGKIKLDGAGNIRLSSNVAGTGVGFTGPGGGTIGMVDTSTGTVTSTSLQFYTPGSAQRAAYVSHSRDSPYFLGSGRMSIVSGYKDSMTIWAGENTGAAFDGAAYGTLTFNAAAFSFTTAKLSIKNHMTVDENAKYQFSTDSGATWANILLRRHEW